MSIFNFTDENTEKETPTGFGKTPENVIDFRGHAIIFRQCQNLLDDVNGGWFHRQPGAFRSFRNVIDALNIELDRSRGFVTEKNAKILAKLTLAAEKRSKEYITFCENNPKNAASALRIERRALIAETMQHVKELRELPLLTAVREKFANDRTMFHKALKDKDMRLPFADALDAQLPEVSNGIFATGI